MLNKLKKPIIYIAFLAMLLVAGYIIFIRENMLISKWYYIVMIVSFVLACSVLLFVILKGRMQDRKSLKMMIILIIVLVVFQTLSLPIANLFSQSFPVWPPRGTIYQMPRLTNSIAQTDVGLMMRYYLNGKTLYADTDFPLESHKGHIYITDEYSFIQEDYPVLTPEQIAYFTQDNASQYYAIHVQNNPKLQIDEFEIFLYVGDDYKQVQEFALVIDEENTWYLIPRGNCEDLIDE